MSATVLEARAVTRVYRMGEVDVHALRGVDFTLDEGEFLVLVGASGSGKSTLLNILGGLDRPTSGTVRFRDRALERASDAELTEYRREHVGFIFQFCNLMPSRSPFGQVEIILDRAVDVLLVPTGALVRRGELWSVFRAGRSRIEEVAVEIGRRSQTEAEVLSGLSEGDRVVVYPGDRVEDGARYRARE